MENYKDQYNKLSFTDCAIKLLKYLAENEDRITPMLEISKVVNQPFHYVCRVGMKLQKAEIIRLIRSTKIGCRLIKKPELITLWDIMNAEVGKPHLSLYVMIALKKYSGKTMQDIYPREQNEEETMKKVFSSITIADIIE